MKHLNEDTIKKLGIRFLKEHYKFRPRTGNTVTSFDQESSDGIITDGLFTFISEDGSPFLATLEATSFESKEEVFFRRQEKLLAWDSAIYAAFLAVTFFALSHHYDWVTINKDGWLVTMFCLVSILAGGYWIARFFVKGFQRYRYIYAIEQFKKYHADEQWIAIADDVFDDHTNNYLEELKSQCVRNGFGLISVNSEEIARILITPSRQEVFGETRLSKKFQNRDEALQYSKREKVKGFWNRMIAKITGNRSTTSVARYQRSFNSQILLGLVAVLILSGIFYKEAQEAPLAYVNEKDYDKVLAEKKKKAKPETPDYVIDSAYVDRNGEKVKPYLEVAGEGVGDTEAHWEVEFAKYFDDYGEQYAEIYISTDEGKYVSYDCERFFNYEGTKYMIQEGTYENVRSARKQLIRLKKQGINAHCLWTGCLNEEEMEFIIFVDFLFDKKKEAGVILTNFKRRFQLEKGYLKIRSITL